MCLVDLATMARAVQHMLALRPSLTMLALCTLHAVGATGPLPGVKPNTALGQCVADAIVCRLHAVCRVVGNTSLNSARCMACY